MSQSPPAIGEASPEEIDELIDRTLSPSSSHDSNRNDYSFDESHDDNDSGSFLMKMFEIRRKMLQELKQKHRESVTKPIQNTLVICTSSEEKSRHPSSLSRTRDGVESKTELLTVNDYIEDSAFCVLNMPSDDEEYFDVDVIEIHGMKEEFHDCLMVPEAGQFEQPQDESQEKRHVSADHIEKLHDVEKEDQVGPKEEPASFEREVSLSAEIQDPSIRHDDVFEDGPPAPALDDSEQRMLDQYAGEGTLNEEGAITEDILDGPPCPTVDDSQEHIEEEPVGCMEDVAKTSDGSGDSGIMSLAELGPYELSSRRGSMVNEEKETDHVASEIDDILDSMFDEFNSMDDEDGGAISSQSSKNESADEKSGHECGDSSQHRPSDISSRSNDCPVDALAAEELALPDLSDAIPHEQQDAFEVLDDFLALMNSMDEESENKENDVTDNGSTERSQVQHETDRTPNSVASSTSSKTSTSTNASNDTSSRTSNKEEQRLESSSDESENDDRDDEEEVSIDDRISECSPEYELVSDDSTHTGKVGPPHSESPRASVTHSPLTDAEATKESPEGDTRLSEEEEIDNILDNVLETMDGLSSKSDEVNAEVNEAHGPDAIVEFKNEDGATVESANCLKGDSEDASISQDSSEKSGNALSGDFGHSALKLECVSVLMPKLQSDASDVRSTEIFSSGPDQKAKSQATIGIGGENSVFSISVPQVIESDQELSETPKVASMNFAVNNDPPIVESDKRTTCDGIEASFTPLQESRSRTTSPDLNSSSNFLEEDVRPSTFRSLEDSQRPHDPIASVLSIGSEDDNQNLESDDNEPEKISGPVSTAEHPIRIEDSKTENDANSVSKDKARNEQREPRSPPRPCRQTELASVVARLHLSPSAVGSPLSRIPSFDQNSVSTISASPASARVSEKASLDRGELSNLELPVLDGLDNKEQGARNENPARRKLSAKQPNAETPVPYKSSTSVAYDPTIPFSNINRRMNQQKQHGHSVSTPHVVASSRSPFRGESFSACKSLLSAGDKSTLHSLRGYYSLASPPRTPAAPPSIAIISRTPRDTSHPLSPAMAATPKSPYHQPPVVCSNKFQYNLHSKMGPCNRCWALASPEEQDKFEQRGSHLRIVRTRGGCDSSCTIFPPKANKSPARLCRQCFFATHQRDGSRVQVYRGNHVKVKLTT
jgi:hypothetical protein